MIERLKSRFPREGAGLDGYFAALEGLVDALGHLGRVRGAGNAVRAAGSAGQVLRWARRTGQDLIEDKDLVQQKSNCQGLGSSVIYKSRAREGSHCQAYVIDYRGIRGRGRRLS